jgi:hypothetical protein
MTIMCGTLGKKRMWPILITNIFIEPEKKKKRVITFIISMNIEILLFQHLLPR